MTVFNLDKLRVSRKIRLSNSELYNATISQYEDMYGHIVVQLEADVLAYIHNPNLQHKETFYNTVTRPRFANPWEHLKARWAGRSWFSWYVKRYPVRFIDETYNVSVSVDMDLQELITFPENRYVFPEALGQPSVVVRETGRKIKWSGAVDKLDPLV